MVVHFGKYLLKDGFQVVRKNFSGGFFDRLF